MSTGESNNSTRHSESTPAMPTFDTLVNNLQIVGRSVLFRRWILRTVQLSIFLAAGVSAFLLRFDVSIPLQFRH